ncbi:ribosomal protein S18 acetylase RimI-like enzyme [Fontibacillus solani]|uniref:Ribosomal protein S18 acetylase RimI-like enzyme n=1 Tax=Fontibacillus solani TaxID=1572857 RepID=A0A7W3SXR3_9BACL|nr:GNAT family N-acetyltransferase [Fontibacillus solani]MBA9088170.1 ribosomal protein S18 acetylase RimI-like enzyme [Fontibacillus solani]
MYRQATKSDASAVITLLFSAIGNIANTLAGTDDDQQAHHVLEHFFQQKGNRISYENVMVKEENEKVIAFMLTYHGSDAASLDQPFIDRLAANGVMAPVIQREAKDDEFYLDSIAVDPDYQGHGIGTEMLQLFERQASERGYDKIMLLVDQDNPAARKLYLRQGYSEDGSITVSGHIFDRMVKKPEIT